MRRAALLKTVVAGLVGAALAAGSGMSPAVAAASSASSAARATTTAASTPAPLASDVVGPVTPGATTVLTVPAGATAEWTFTAARGQYVRLSVGQVAGQAWGCSLDIAVVGPDGSTLYDNGCVVDGSQLDRATAITSGEHRLRLVSSASSDLQVQVTLTVARDQRLGLAPDTATTVALRQPGQHVVQTFAGTKGQIPSLTLTGSTFPSYDLQMVLEDRYGHELRRSYQSSAYAWEALPANGTYTLTVVSASAVTGRFTETLGLSVPAVYALTKGVPQTIPPISDGTVQLTFRGAVGRTAVLQLAHGAWEPTSVWLFSPEGIGIASGFVYGSGTGSSGFDFGFPLPSTGTYTIWLDGGLEEGATVQVDTGSASSAGALQPGTPTTVSVTKPGASRTLTFSGSVGQRPVVSTSAAAWGGGGAWAVVRRPDGSEFGRVPVSADEPFAELSPLDGSGVWTVTVDPEMATTGSVTLTLDLVTDQVVDVVPGTPVHVAVDVPGQNVVLRVPVAADRRLTLSTTGAVWSSVSPSGASMATSLQSPTGGMSSMGLYSTSAGSSFTATDYPVGVAGTWRLVLDPVGASVGSSDLLVDTVADATVAVTRGATTTLAVTRPGQVVTGSVSVPYGARLTARLVSSTWSGSAGPAASPRLNVQVGNNLLGGLDFGSDPAGSFARTDPWSGSSTSWSVVVDPAGDVTGSVTLVLDAVRDVVVPAALGGTTRAAVTKPGQSVVVTFDAGQGQQLPWALTAQFTGNAAVRYPGGTYAPLLAEVGPQTTSGVVTLGGTGGYALVVTPNGAQTGSVSVRLG